MKERYLMEIGGENTKLGKFEAIELFKAENYNPKLIFDNKKIVVIEVDTKIEPKIAQRLAMTRRISRIVFFENEKSIDQIIKKISVIDIGKKSFAIRVIGHKNVSESNIAEKLGEKISPENATDLSDPDVKILYYENRKSIISLWDRNLVTYYNKCLKHHIKFRPFFSPIGIHPRIARSMVNLSGCRNENKIIDPFCGTGGILIEAASMDIGSVGLDILPKMIKYSKGNLTHYGLISDVFQGDVLNTANYDIDAIVTDPPYGISTTTKGEGVKDLMERSLNIFSDKLEKGKRLVITVSNPKLIIHKNFKLLYIFDWYIHKSLTRHIMVLEKISR